VDEAKFWQIIESFDWTKKGDDVAVMQPAIDTLAKLTEADLNQFDEILTKKLYDLDTQAHATSTGFGVDHFSVDSFLYERCCVVVNGRAYYERVLNNPTLMPKELWFDAVLYLAYRASIIMGIEDYFSYTGLYETFSNEAGWRDADFPDELPPGHKPSQQR
jgi:hypothetical protein